MPKLDITSQERSALRSAAHPLRPVVMIGDKGLTDAVLKEIDGNLKAHGLIKVRVAGHERDDREQMLEAICDQLSCAAVHHLGKILILHRPGADKKAPPAEPSTRAVRKASEPYTPKKLAASGTTLTRQDVKRQRAGRKSDDPADAVAAGKPTRRPARVAAGARDSHGIPRRNGSALSLRAGARRNVPRGR